MNSLKIHSVIKSILFSHFIMTGFWGGYGKEFCWVDGKLWE